MGEGRQKFVLSAIGVLQSLLDLLALGDVPRHHLNRLFSLPDYGPRGDLHCHPRSIKPRPEGLSRSKDLLLVDHETHPFAHAFVIAGRYDVKGRKPDNLACIPGAKQANGGLISHRRNDPSNSPIWIPGSFPPARGSAPRFRAELRERTLSR